MNIQSLGRSNAGGEGLAPVIRRSMFATPEYKATSASIEHVPFAFWLVDVLRPPRIVALGTPNGVSYSAMCEAVKTLGLATSCYAIDTRNADEHAAFEDDVIRDFATSHDRRYGAFSHIVRSPFGEALPHFEDGSIDLLHIEHLDTYEAARHDYETWLPKLAANAVVVFHATNVRERELGVFRLWDEITTDKPHFHFIHGQGLGVLGHGHDYPDALRALFDASEDSRLVGMIRETFEALGRSVRMSYERTSLEQSISEHSCELGRLRRALASPGAALAGLREERVWAREIGALRGALAAPQGNLAGLDHALAQIRDRMPTALTARDDELAGSDQRLAAIVSGVRTLQHAAISERYGAPSRHIGATLGGISTPVQRPWRTARRMQAHFARVCAAQLNRATTSLLPLYRRYLPEWVRRLASVHLPEQLKQRFIADHTTLTIGYETWVLQNEKMSDDDRVLIRAHIAAFCKRPKLSVLMPVYDTPAAHLRAAIDSVLGQLYPEWQLCIADDASACAEVHDILSAYARMDSRIKVCFRDANGGISACTNTALEIATGEWIVLMDPDDTLSEHALYLVAEATARDPDLAIIYSDEDRIDENGRRSRPYFKPDWNYELFLGQNLINHLGVYRIDLARLVGGFREGFEGAQDWDFALRVLEASGNAKVHHIPFVLYHSRQASQPFSKSSVARAIEAACRAMSDHLTRSGQAAEAVPSAIPGYLEIRRALPAERPLISIIIPSKDRRELLEACIDGLSHRTDYKPIEIVIVDNASNDPDTLDFLDGLRTRAGFVVVEDKGPFNFSRLVNCGVARSSGKICVLLNNDIDVINADWLDELAVHALRSEVGAVGAKLYYADDRLQHGGVILGIGGAAAHPYKSAPRNTLGYFGRLQLTHSLSCVTAACIAVRREVYDEIGGFDEEHLAVALNDVDFCIRLRKAGYKIIWTPRAELYHYESVSRGSDMTPKESARFSTEKRYMRTRWSEILDNDPCYNPNLSLSSDFFEIAAISRSRKPWLARSNAWG